MKIHILDMGLTKYGDCLVIEKGDRRILIDGGHPGDTNSIRTQLKRILKQDAPFVFDLLVVTHCHLDHIGCLPDLIGLDIIKPQKALIADEKLGFSRTRKGVSLMDEISVVSDAARLIPALEEESHSDLSDEALIQFLDDAATLESKYLKMIERLEAANIPVLRYGSDITLEVKKKKMLAGFEKEFKDFGLKILGPTQDHLVICAEGISNTVKIADDLLVDNIGNDYALIDNYRKLVNKPITDDALGMEDKIGSGAAKNNQSLVFKVSSDGWSALLAGDMQFARAEVKGLNDSMEKLLATIGENGPYEFVKLTHHTSYNGLNENVFRYLKGTKLLAHTGGSNDASHPEKGALEFLKKIGEGISFARTDRNGIISVSKNGDELTMEINKGTLNDFSLNRLKDEEGPVTPEPIFNTPPIPNPLPPIQPLVNRAEEDGFVEIHAKIPNQLTKVTITIDVQPGGAGGGKQQDNELPTGNSKFLIAPGRVLPNLLLVTSFNRLAENIGKSHVDNLIKLVAQYSQLNLVNIEGDLKDIDSISAYVSSLTSTGAYKGVVIIGGYDVVPSEKIDALDTALRQELTTSGRVYMDADEFLVWSDNRYGDIDKDGFAEIPVSRIPDGRDSSLIYATLGASKFDAVNKFGIRNYARPFAENIYTRIPGNSAGLNVSEQFSPAHVGQDVAMGAVYYMLHGSHRDSSRFWGETIDGGAFEAIGVENIPTNASGSIVFTGCCWGALSVREQAVRVGESHSINPRQVKDSMALSYLQAGALAFVGCTGSHYSPFQEPFNYYGRPMHEYFWQGISSGLMPAEALFRARVRYAQSIPHELTDSFSRAIELKIFHQYTCLGFGW